MNHNKFHFGKYPGLLVSDCQDVEYMQFMVDKADINKRFRVKLEDQILKIKQQLSSEKSK